MMKWPTIMTWTAWLPAWLMPWQRREEPDNNVDVQQVQTRGMTALEPDPAVCHHQDPPHASHSVGLHF